jgi:competence protein ComFC
MAGKHKRPAYFCYRTFWALIDWLYPPICSGCGSSGLRWCITCQSNTARIGQQICEQCGEPNSTTGKCGLCLQSPPAFTAVRSWAVYGGAVRQALHDLKYRQNIALGDTLSIHLLQLYNELNWQIDIIVPVPLSRKRKRARGYNQSALLARPLSLATGVSYRANALQRVRDTVSQVGLSGKERSINVRGAFAAQSKFVRGKTILVIDDITTTGATIQNCAAALLEAGAVHVYGLTVARAIPETHNDSENNNSSII